ncbi:MAG: hypothetical protein EOO15_22805 [Chitinophagaceae bacterium]|nr:MAG: hypothetical protein EOO15_22805 [Chitinophagaceae bacterium]
MPGYSFYFICSFSIAIAALLGLFRINRSERRFVPFFVFLCTGFLNEIASDISGRIWQTNSVNTDIYMLMESMILLWLFYEWRVFRKWTSYALIAGSFVIVWVYDTFITGSLADFSSRFHTFYSFVIVLLSIQYINRLIVSEQRLTLKNAEFLICICLLLFYTAAAIVEIFWFYGFENNVYFVSKIYVIVPIVNLITNLIYALAVLWIPRKPAFITLS